MKNLLKFSLLLLVIVSCTKDPEIPPSNYIIGGGVLILNEGNFMAGNGSLSFYSYDSSKVYNDLFTSINGRPLGDVPNSIIIKSDKAYIVVNNSGKIEVVDQNTLESKATISGLISPRVMTPINDNKAYVSSLYSDSVTIIDLSRNTISGYINLRRSSEAIVAYNNKAYISNWMGGKEVMVVNTLNDRVVDSIQVGDEPESMVLDNRRVLWVLCNGGWARQNFAKLMEINTSTDEVQKEYAFSSLQDSPTCLKIDSYGQTLYFLDKGVKQMDINLGKLPATTLIAESNASFYKIAVNPVNSDIFITDAVDYTQPGYVLLYKNDGTFMAKEKAGIIPGSMCFRIKFNAKP
jgi:DNA-binding beta-propeller fold protein YncE